jgi:hypothetical protein
VNLSRPTRILVVTDRTAATPELVSAIAERARSGPSQFRIVVPNPAAAELHPLHPERHDKAREAEEVLHDAIREIEAVVGAPVIGSVSVRHDPVDASEQTMTAEPIDEIILSVVEHGLTRWLHQDLQHRLKHLGLPVTAVVSRGR